MSNNPEATDPQGDNKCTTCDQPHGDRHNPVIHQIAADVIGLSETARQVNEASNPAAGFEQWWLDLVSKRAPVIESKAKEYGSNSLAEVGRLVARMQGREIEVSEALQLGCAFYAYGKMQRVADSMIRGALPSADTIEDLMIYAAMMRYISETGMWP